MTNKPALVKEVSVFKVLRQVLEEFVVPMDEGA